MYNKDYNIVKDSINLVLLIEQLDAEETIPDPASIAFSKDGETLALMFADDLTSEQILTLDTIISNHNPEILEELKNKRRKEIDERTTEIVAEGISFNGVVISGSVESQSRIMGAFIAGANAPFPLRWMSQDDTTYIDITDASMMAALFYTGLGTLKSKIDTGTTLKVAIIEATTIEEVNNIIDPR